MRHSTLLLLSSIACMLALAHAATVYYGGDILTMAGPTPQYAQALVVKGGKIAFLGSKEDAIKNAGLGATMVDLKGRTLMPGFIDAHGHVVLAAHSMLNANLDSVKDIPELIKVLKEHAKSVPEPYWIEGMGYVAAKFGRHPTVEEMDQVSTTRPVFAQDKSGHQGAVNSVMLKLMNITKDSPNPEGGVYYRKPGTTIPDGHIAETAVMAVMANRPLMSSARTKQGLDKALKVWLENGQTTATDLGIGLNGDDVEIVKMMVDNKWLPIDLIVFAKIQLADQAINVARDITAKYSGGTPATRDARIDGDNRYINRVRGAGVKLWLDGSPPTALMSKPFVNENDPNDKKYTGVQNDPPALMDATAAKYYDTNTQIHAHAIGDKAIENFISAFEKVMKVKGYPPKTLPVLQHAAFLRPDQLKRMKVLGIIPSFTMGALYPFAKVYYSMYTPEVISWANPAKSAIKEGLIWTSNHDFPAGGSPSLIDAVWNAVNRPVRDGGKDGIPLVTAPEQRVTPYEALQSITINAAKQHNETRTKGSLVVGKLADLVILSANPVKVPPMDINKIVVVETIKEGKTLYTRTGYDKPPTSEGQTTVDGDPHGAHPLINRFTGLNMTEKQAAALGSLLAGNNNNNGNNNNGNNGNNNNNNGRRLLLKA